MDPTCPNFMVNRCCSWTAISTIFPFVVNVRNAVYANVNLNNRAPFKPKEENIDLPPANTILPVLVFFCHVTMCKKS